jgi:putative protease
LQIEWSIHAGDKAGTGVRTRVQSNDLLSPSQKHPLTPEFLREQLGRLGGTPYTLADIHADIQGNPFAPSSLLNDLRRQAVSRLQQLQSERPYIDVHDASSMLDAAIASSSQSELTNASKRASRPQPQLHLLVRTPEQLDAAVALRPASITLDYLDLYGLRPAVERVVAAGINARVASPRVLKPEEERIVIFLLGLECDIVVRSGGLLQALTLARRQTAATKPPTAWVGDFSLNASNVLTARAFLELGLQRLTPTHDLNAAQIADLAVAIGPQKLEVIAYQHLPVFHTEHCVFCRFLSNGTSYEDCGRPCEKHRVALRDANGRAHPVMADVGCRNTVFGAEAQEASEHLERWRNAGLEHYRLEFVHETADQVAQTTNAFSLALNGKLSAVDLRSRLKRVSSQGVTEGSLFVAENYLEVPSMG